MLPTHRVQSHAETHDLIESHLSLISHLVRERMAKLPSHVCPDELESAALLALLLAARSFDPDRGVPFAHFATIRIRGAIIDELRGMDWASRSVRSRARAIDSASSQLALVLDRTPQTQEVADAMRLTTRELAAVQADVARASVLSLQDLASGAAGELPTENSDGPESLLLRRELLGYLHDAVAELPDRLRRVVTAYFFDQRSMSDIGAEFGITQARVSQLCTEALMLLRDGMNSQLDPAAIKPRIQSSRMAATRESYFTAIAGRSTLRGRLSMSTSMGDILRREDRYAPSLIA